jgi:small-conductance mechanosensitive channel
MTIQEILDTELFHLGDYSLTVSSIVSFILVIVIANIVKLAIKKIMIRKRFSQTEEKKRYTAYRIISYFIWTIAIVLALESAGLSVNVLLAGSAALLVGVGLGLQQTFNDLVSGLILLFEGSIKLNDVVVVDGEYGQITEIGLRTSKIVTRDNIIMIIPNSKFIVENVVNWSYNEPETRFKVSVGVAYGSDVPLVKKLLLEVAHDNKKVLDSPEPSVLFTDFGDSALIFDLYFWTDNAFEEVLIKSDIRYKIDDKFRENNVSIPFPQRDLHFKSNFPNV